jgi:nitroimidazol reductase NimA-like FMN-containing flavoprotein (pyridoxamine 5'-phosphate oxidase superfamily)
MATWAEFASADPALADAGKGLLYQFGVGLAFLATVRRDGGPRVHPVCPFVSNGRLYVLIRPESPKRDDLARDGRYALQTFPPPRKESEEFYVTGRAALVEDPETWKRAFADAKHLKSADEGLFELTIERVMHTTWEHWGTPEMRPVHTKWRARSSRPV